MTKERLPKHLQVMLDKAMRTNKGRKSLAKIIGATYYKNKAGKIIKAKIVKKIIRAKVRRRIAQKRILTGQDIVW